jgi:hypothetical protein
MKYLGEEIKKEIVTKSIRDVKYIRCDCCRKKILPNKYRDEKSSYFRIHTWHNDWGNDSIDSHEYRDFCKDCAREFVDDYISHAGGSDELELQHEYLYENEAYDGLDDGYALVENDRTEWLKGE